MRTATIERATKETQISVTVELDEKGRADIDTGIGFFDHMLTALSVHSGISMTVKVKGDLNVDCHHTIEDTGIVLGTAIRQALGEKAGIRRYGDIVLPMDEALVLCAIDLSGRPYFNFDYEFRTERVGYFDTEMVREFFYAVSYSAMMNLHFKVLDGMNAHHIIEAMFKAFAKALDEATTEDPRLAGESLTTKGSI